MKEIKKYDENLDLTPYLEGNEYDYEGFILKARHNTELMLDGMLRVGNCLICIKKMEGHGNWEKALEKIGISQQRANEFMAISFCFKNKILPNLSEGKIKQVEKLGKTRMLLLARLPEEILKQFEDGEFPEGLEIDDLNSISVKDLKEKFDALKKQYDTGMKQNKKLKDEIEKIKEKTDLEGLEKINEWHNKFLEILAKGNEMIKNLDKEELINLNREHSDILQALISPISDLIESMKFKFEQMKQYIGVE